MSNPLTPELSTKNLIILASYGACLWLIAAMIVRFGGPLGAFDGHRQLLAYGLVIPGTVPAVMLAKQIAGLTKPQMLPGIAIVTASAALLDGIALAWFPALYGSDIRIVMSGAAIILWGVGVGLVIGWAMGRR